jgi:uncharacterized protein YcbX
MINEELYARLTADGTVSGLVASRIYPHKARFTPTYPHVIYEVTSEEPSYSFAGVASAREANVTYQCIAETYREARTIAAAIESSLSGFRGLLTTHFVHATFVDGVRDDKIQKTEDADSFYYAVNVLVSVHYE